MAEPAALHTCVTGLGFTQEAAAYIVNEQGFDSVDDYLLLSDEEATNICKITRHPGGQTADGEPNAGLTVSLKAENHLKMLCFYLRHRRRTSNTIAIAQATPANVRALLPLSRSEKEHKDPKLPEFSNKVFKIWTRVFDILDDYFRNCLGTTKIPLAYIIQDDVEPMADPPSGWPNRTEEMVSRAPHTSGNPPVPTQAYKEDNITVFNKLAEIFCEKDCWSYM